MNMCSVRQRPMPSAPNSRAFAASSGVSAFARTRSRRNVVGPAEDRPEVLVDRGRDERHGADDHASGAAVDREHDRPRAARRSPIRSVRASTSIDERLAAGDARLAHPAGDDRGVRGHPAVRRQDAAGVDEAVDVVRRRLPADEDARPRLRGRAPRPGRRRARSRRRRRRETRSAPSRPRRRRRPGSIIGCSSWSSWPASIARDGLLAGDEPLARHLDRDAQRRLRRPLSRARLEQVERAVLDRELDVLHLAVVLLEPLERLDAARA